MYPEKSLAKSEGNTRSNHGSVENVSMFLDFDVNTFSAMDNVNVI
jgi:hypothetical protein